MTEFNEVIEPMAIKLADIFERTIRKQEINRSTLDKALYLLTQRDMFDKPIKKVPRKRTKKKVWPDGDSTFPPTTIPLVVENNKSRWKPTVMELSGECES